MHKRNNASHHDSRRLLEGNLPVRQDILDEIRSHIREVHEYNKSVDVKNLHVSPGVNKSVHVKPSHFRTADVLSHPGWCTQCDSYPAPCDDILNQASSDAQVLCGKCPNYQYINYYTGSGNDTICVTDGFGVYTIYPGLGADNIFCMGRGFISYANANSKVAFRVLDEQINGYTGYAEGDYSFQCEVVHASDYDDEVTIYWSGNISWYHGVHGLDLGDGNDNVTVIGLGADSVAYTVVYGGAGNDTMTASNSYNVAFWAGNGNDIVEAVDCFYCSIGGGRGYNNITISGSKLVLVDNDVSACDNIIVNVTAEYNSVEYTYPTSCMQQVYSISTNSSALHLWDIAFGGNFFTQSGQYFITGGGNNFFHIGLGEGNITLLDFDEASDTFYPPCDILNSTQVLQPLLSLDYPLSSLQIEYGGTVQSCVVIFDCQAPSVIFNNRACSDISFLSQNMVFEPPCPILYHVPDPELPSKHCVVMFSCQTAHITFNNSCSDLAFLPQKSQPIFSTRYEWASRLCFSTQRYQKSDDGNWIELNKAFYEDLKLLRNDATGDYTNCTAAILSIYENGQSFNCGESSFPNLKNLVVGSAFVPLLMNELCN